VTGILEKQKRCIGDIQLHDGFSDRPFLDLRGVFRTDWRVGIVRPRPAILGRRDNVARGLEFLHRLGPPEMVILEPVFVAAQALLKPIRRVQSALKFPPSFVTVT